MHTILISQTRVMDIKILLQLLLCLWCFSESQHLGASKILSKQEEMEIKEELKLINKPSVKTIWTRYGEKYDCVDFYKQRAFDHPALKSHNFHLEMRPSLYPHGNIYKGSSSTHQLINNLWLNGKGCPIGFIPVKRVTKDDLKRIKVATKIYAKRDEPFTSGEPGTHYAIIHTNNGPGTSKKIYGAGMVTSVYNPPVLDTQYSSSQVKIINGRESIEFGWMVNPALFGDNRTHVFIYTNTGAAHCFNTYCPGFVSVRQDMPIGAAYGGVSTRGGIIYDLPILIYRDLAPMGPWWLAAGPDEDIIGFWPQNIFKVLANFGTYAEWGGKAYSPSQTPSPPMGAGFDHFKYDLAYDAYCFNISTIDESFVVVDEKHTSSYADVKQYRVDDVGIVPNKDLRHILFFGGKGGYIGN